MMRAVIVIACVIGIAVGESCNGVDTTQCANEICATGFVPTCVTNICTCNPRPDPTGCQTVGDCNQYWFSHHCSHVHKQCMNGHCSCAHGHGNGGR